MEASEVVADLARVGRPQRSDDPLNALQHISSLTVVKENLLAPSIDDEIHCATAIVAFSNCAQLTTDH